MWKERDDALKQKYEKINNEILPKVAADKQARIVAKVKKNTGMAIKSMPALTCKVLSSIKWQ